MARSRTLIGIGAQSIRDDVARAAQDYVALAGVYMTPDALFDQIDDGIDLVIVDVGMLRALARRLRRGGVRELRHEPAVILVLSDNELRDALGLLHLCRGILFWQHDLDKLGRLIVITLEGYSGVPPELLLDLISDRVRLSLIDTLAPVERQTLQLLGQALSNRAISRALGVAEPAAKSLVRTVLTKLRLKNRTEAAILAARWYGSEFEQPARGAMFVSEQPEHLAS